MLFIKNENMKIYQMSLDRYLTESLIMNQMDFKKHNLAIFLHYL
jgi:hypothetical protein